MPKKSKQSRANRAKMLSKRNRSDLTSADSNKSEDPVTDTNTPVTATSENCPEHSVERLAKILPNEKNLKSGGSNDAEGSLSTTASAIFIASDDSCVSPLPLANRNKKKRALTLRKSRTKKDSTSTEPISHSDSDGSVDLTSIIKRGRGRPRNLSTSDDSSGSSRCTTPAKRARGRPKKTTSNSDCERSDDSVDLSDIVKKGRGRPRKLSSTSDDSSESSRCTTPAKRARGNPEETISSCDRPVVCEESNDAVKTPVKRSRGRPRKLFRNDSFTDSEGSGGNATPIGNVSEISNNDCDVDSEESVNRTSTPTRRGTRRTTPKKTLRNPSLDDTSSQDSIGNLCDVLEAASLIEFDKPIDIPVPSKRARGRPRKSSATDALPNRNENLPLGIVIRGDYHQGSAATFGSSASKQCTACAVMAITYRHFTDKDMWSPQIVNSVVNYGDSLYKKSLVTRPPPVTVGRGHNTDYLHIEEVHKQFIISDNVGVRIEVELGQSVDDFVGVGASTLRTSLIQFMANHQNGVLVCNVKSLAVFKYDPECFCIFDSHSCNEQGFSEEGGVANFIRYRNVEDVANHIARYHDSIPRSVQFSLFPLNVRVTNDLADFTDVDRLNDETQRIPPQLDENQTPPSTPLPRPRRSPRRRTAIATYNLGEMDNICQHCNALFFSCERAGGICCNHGDIVLGEDQNSDYPDFMEALLTNNHQHSRHFIDKVRAYNSNLAFASVKLNREYPSGRGPPVIVISGIVYHNIGRVDENDVRFGSIYFCETDVADRRFDGNRNADALNLRLLNTLEAYLRNNNPFALIYRQMRTVLEQYRAENPDARPNLAIRFHTDLPNLDRRRYNRPQNEDEVGAAYVSVDGEMPPPDVLIVYHVNNTNEGQGERGNLRLKEITKLNEIADPLCYPVLFPHGERGWNRNIMRTKHAGRVTMRQFYCYHLMRREQMFNQRLMAGRLTQQFIIDAYSKVEGDRLHFLRQNQRQIRADTYAGLQDYVSRQAETQHGEGAIGRLVVLPGTFTSGKRYMTQCYQDAMAIVGKYGKPSLFITMTCNPKWPEIVAELGKGDNGGPFLKAQDRPDIVARVFHQKLNALIEKVVKENYFGRVVAWVYVIEFQKRGLPHAHILITLAPEDKIRTAEQVDSIISAEIPNPETDPRLYEIVTKTMIHGPCGERNPNSPCMDKDKGCCTKKYPQSFAESTILTEGRRPTYRRRDDGRKTKITVNGTEYEIDNRDVVPYNPELTLMFDCHINVLLVTSVQNVKYLFKYITKGADAALISVEDPNDNRTEYVFDEIRDFQDTRYLSAMEAAWRLFKYGIVYKSHVVVRLPVHLQDERTLYFEEGEEENAVLRAEEHPSMLDAFFNLNANDPEANRYVYTEIPFHYRYDTATGVWRKRQYNRNIVTRMYTISPRWTEKFHLRVLLLHVPGPKSYEDLLTVDGQRCSSFREAAEKRHLISTDDEWVRTMQDAAAVQMPGQMRKVFCYLLCYCQVSAPADLWHRFADQMAEDLARHCRGDLIEARRRALIRIEDFLTLLGRRLREFDIEPPTRTVADNTDDPPAADGAHADIQYETAMSNLGEAIDNERLFNVGQRLAYDTVLKAVADPSLPDRYFYLQGGAGTGKTFLYNTLLSQLASQGKPTLAVAFTGIAALLLRGGRTVHSTFMLPLNVDADSTSNMRSQSPEADRLRKVELIVWDEISMTSNHILNTVDKLLRDLKSKPDVPFGGCCVLLGGDIRQLLPVHELRVMQQEQCFVNCMAWPRFKKLELTENRRTDADEIEFANWLIALGDGSLRPDTAGIPAKTSIPLDSIDVPARCLTDDVVRDIYGDIDFRNPGDFSDRAILCPKNDDCLTINDKLSSRLCTEERIFLSVDSVVTDDPEERLQYPEEFLNTLRVSGMPDHRLILREGVPIMLLRNLCVRDGLTNGTRLILKSYRDHLLRAVIATGCQKGKEVLIPKMDLTTVDKTYPFTLRRRQFPVKVCFAITINKAQGQTFERVGIYLNTPVFSHGQLYVAFSRARRWDAVKVQVTDGKDQGKLIKGKSDRVFTRNVVCRDLLRRVFEDAQNSYVVC